MKGKIIYPLMILLLFLFVSAEAIESQKLGWKGSITKEGDVVVVKNPKEPLYKNAIFTIREELSIGGENVPPKEVLSLVTGIDVGPDGFIYIADFKQCEIKIFDKSGKFLRAFGKKGQGPGEFLLLMEISYCASQKELFVHDRLRRFYFDPEGNFKRSVSYRFNFTSVKADARGNLSGIVEIRSENGFRYELRLLDEHGNLGSLLNKKSVVDTNVENPYQPILTWCIRPDGAIIEGYPETYEILIHNSDGRIVRRVVKEYNPVEVTAAEREIFTKSTFPSARKRKYEFSRYHAAFAALTSDEKGWIYARTWDKAPDGKSFLYDIFDQDGRYIAKTQLPGYGQIFRDGKLYLIDEDANGYQVIKRYALIWKKDVY